MKNYINILALIIFILGIWTVNSFIYVNVNESIVKIQNSKKDLALKASFDKQGDPIQLSKSIDEFVPEKLDKGQLSNLISRFANEASVGIQSLSIKESVNLKNNNQKSDENNNFNNKLKAVSIEIKIKGTKQSIYNFCSKLSQSKQYMDIYSINLDFNKYLNSLSSSNQDVEGDILVITYYTKL